MFCGSWIIEPCVPAFVENLSVAGVMRHAQLRGRIKNIDDQLIRSGLGNDVRFIKTPISERKRRAASVRR